MYNQTIQLSDNEQLMKVNSDTGEVTEVRKRINNIPIDKHVFEPDAIFKKDYTSSWKFLKEQCTHLELSAAVGLSLLAKANTNSLEPINDETALKELSEKLNVSKNKIDAVLKKLWKLGVYGKFEVYDVNKPYTKYWILNPYLSFTGKLIKSDIAELFSGTMIAIAFRNEKV